jgi:ribosomal protein S4
MAFQLGIPRFRKYKFFGNNVWGNIYILKKFRAKDVVFSRINKRLTLKHILVNPVKLRQKRKSFRTLCLYMSLECKRYYHSMRETQFRRILRKSVKGIFDNLIRSPDRLVNLLELRLDGLLLKTGLFSHPAYVRHLVKYRHILVDGKVVDYTSSVLKIGSVISFGNNVVAVNLLLNLLRIMYKINLTATRLDIKDYGYLFYPFYVINRLCYLSFCLKTLTIRVIAAPTYVKNVYYPFGMDISKIYGGYPFIR